VRTAVRLAIRSLARRPAYAAVVVAILALGIGANTAIFGVVDAVLLRSLPYSHAESLVVVFADGSARGQGQRVATTPADFFEWRDQADGAFAGMAALRNASARITSLDVPVVPLTHVVTANYFDVLGAAPILGRSFRTGDDAPGRDDVVMLSYGLWQAKFGGDRTIVGRTIGLDGKPHVVVGVMGPDFYSAHIFNVQPDLWLPASLETERDDRSTRDIVVYARLKPGTPVATAQASMRVVAARIAARRPETDDRWSIALVPLREHVVGAFTRIAALVLAAVGLVLLMACANVANLALARGAERTGEVAVRTALGAGPGRIAAELLVESLVLAAAGGVAGAVIAWLGIPALVHLIPTGAGVPFLQRASVDLRVLGFAVAASLGAAALCGVLPARQAARLDVIDGLRRAGRGAVSPAARRWRRVLVAVEVALAVVVLACATLMTRTLVGLERVPTGFRADRIAKLRTSLRGEAFAAPAARVAHFEELQRRLSAIGSVSLVSAVSFEPPTPAGRIAAVRLRLPGFDDPASAPSAVSRVVMADYFEAIGIPIVKGRGITAVDRADSARVAVISDTMARRYFSGQDPIGRTFSLDNAGAAPLRIVGVAGDVLTEGIDPSPQPTFYLPYAQNPLPVMTLVMQVTRGDPAAVLVEAERIAWSIAPSTNVYAVETMAARLQELNWRARFAAVILGSFAALGLVLAAAGLYAVVSYGVAQRRSEIGLRMALGASVSMIVTDVLGEGLLTVAVGLAIGNAAALAFTRGLTGLLYGVAPGDPLTLATVSISMLVVAAGACAVPAMAAARVDPQAALQEG
jgi:putative ABC transport system permease protein